MLVGSGTLITFPVLLAIGLPPVVANVSNTIGLVPGSFSGAWGYRRELAGQGRRARRPAACAVGGGVLAVALGLIVLQPRIARRLAAGRPEQPEGSLDDEREGLGPRVGTVVAGIYGGYFGAAQGILQLAILGLAFPRERLQRINAVKNVTTGSVNLVSGIVFAVVADVDWGVVALIAVGSTIGGSLSGRFGRRIPAGALRGLIVVVGIAAMVQLLT